MFYKEAPLHGAISNKVSLETANWTLPVFREENEMIKSQKCGTSSPKARTSAYQCIESMLKLTIINIQCNAMINNKHITRV